MTEPLILKPEDSGTSEFPVIFRAVNGTQPVFYGGKKFRDSKKYLKIYGIPGSRRLWNTDGISNNCM